MVVEPPQSTRVEEPTLLCNHLVFGRFHFSGYRVYQDLTLIAEPLAASNVIPLQRFTDYFGSLFPNETA
jgi:hypothetical protein